MTALELIVRTAAATASLILALALLRARQATLRSRLFGAALCVGVAAYLACSASFRLCSGTWLSPAMWLASGVPFFFWGWTLSIMDDEFAVSPLALAAAATLIGVTIVGATTTVASWRAAVVTVHSLLGVGFVTAALVSVLRGWRQDLIEARRRLRPIVIVLCGAYSMVILIVELFLRAAPASETLLLVNAVLLAALLLGLVCAVLEVSTSARSAFGWMPAISPSVQPAPLAARDREQELVGRLQELMTRNGAYRDAEIAIVPLAAKLGVQEKKLRETINGRLGFKNFPAYVNAFRLEEVRQRLSDPMQDGIPILTLALEAGFGSAVAFNRAFKDRYGVTPSAYRSNRDQQTEAART